MNNEKNITHKTSHHFEKIRLRSEATNFGSISSEFRHSHDGLLFPCNHCFKAWKVHKTFRKTFLAPFSKVIENIIL